MAVIRPAHWSGFMHLAANANEQEPLHIERLNGGEHVQVRRQRRLHSLRCQDVCFAASDHLSSIAKDNNVTLGTAMQLRSRQYGPVNTS